MKSFVVGACLTSFAWGLPERRGWRLELLTAPPLATSDERSRHQVSVQAGSYVDSVSTEVNGLIDFGPVELGVKGSTLAFPRLTDTGQEFYNEHVSERTAAEIELGRQFLTLQKHYGRVGIGGLRLMPNGRTWLHLSTSTGIFESADMPWQLHLHIDYFRTFSRESNMIVAAGESLRLLSETPSRWQVGGSIFWTYRLRDVADDTGNVYEHMYFSFAPILEYFTPSSRLRLSFPWRIWLDYTVYKIPNVAVPGEQVTITSYPSEIRLPDVQLQFIQMF